MALHTKVDSEGLDAQYLSASPLFAPGGEGASVPKQDRHIRPDRLLGAVGLTAS
jgi:hypothetical protein